MDRTTVAALGVLMLGWLSGSSCATKPATVEKPAPDPVMSDARVQHYDKFIVFHHYYRQGTDRSEDPDAEAFFAGKCADVADPELRAICSRSCDQVPNPDLASFCTYDCGKIQDANTAATCRRECDAVEDPDAKKLCLGREKEIATAERKLARDREREKRQRTTRASVSVRRPRGSAVSTPRHETGDSPAPTEQPAGLAPIDYAWLAGLMFDHDESICAPDCYRDGWSFSNELGETTAECNFGSCLKDGWTLTFPDGVTGEVECNFNNCLEDGWELQVADGTTASSECSFAKCATDGWTTQVSDGSGFECTCSFGNCREDGVECN